MKTPRSAALSLALFALIAAPAALRAENSDHQHAHATAPAVSGSGSERMAKARADYPLDTCVVSGDKLGEMGKPFEYVYKAEGQPDRLVLFCCKGCVKDFKKDPAKYLKKLDEAAAAKAPDKH